MRPKAELNYTLFSLLLMTEFGQRNIPTLPVVLLAWFTYSPRAPEHNETQ